MCSLVWKDPTAPSCTAAAEEQKIGCAAVKLELQLREPRD